MQNDKIKFIGNTAKSLGGRSSEAFLFRFGKGGLFPRLATSYYFLSSHLQM